MKVNCQDYERFLGLIENAISDFVLITEEGLKTLTGVLEKVMWKVKKECHQLGLYLGKKKQIVEMLFQEAKKA